MLLIHVHNLSYYIYTDMDSSHIQDKERQLSQSEVNFRQGVSTKQITEVEHPSF
jgi:hypothetical protein